LTALDATSVLVVTEILDVVFLTLRHRQGYNVRLPSSYDATRRRQRTETQLALVVPQDPNEMKLNKMRKGRVFSVLESVPSSENIQEPCLGFGTDRKRVISFRFRPL
jgi:hypothetical protein